MKNKLVLGALIVLTLTSCGVNGTADAPITEEVVVRKPTLIEPLAYDFSEYVVVVDESPTTVTYRVTAYCACERCCGKWALNRPKDENGNPIVYGAGGVKLVSGFSGAGTLPFGTQVKLDGYGVVEVQDRFANWIVDKHGENIIDIYFDDHDTAWNFGVKYLEGMIINDA